MASHYSSIGFPVRSREDLAKIVLRTAESAASLATNTGHTYLPWSVGHGIEVWAQMSPDGELLGCNPHFAGEGRILIRVTELASDDELHNLDGALEGWVNPNDAEGGDYPLRVDLPDFVRVKALIAPSRTVILQVAAFAHELSCYASDEEFKQSQTEPYKLAPEALIPTGLFVQHQADHCAEAMFSGHVRSMQRVVNPEGGGTFFHLVVSTLGGAFDVVADPEIVTGEPIVGGVVRGTFWLSGRVVPSADERPAGGAPAD